MEIIAYEMQYDKEFVEMTNISCIPFEQKYFENYKSIYNECFYDMRKSLDIEPYNFLEEYKQLAGKECDIFLLMKKGVLIGSVACYGNEIDDLIVNREHQNQGYGKQLLLWAMKQIRNKNNEPIILHVAEWNQKAVKMYKTVGFEITKIEKASTSNIN